MKSIIILFAIITIVAAQKLRSIEENPQWREEVHSNLVQYYSIDEINAASSSNARIINGNEATPHQFPHQVAIFLWINQTSFGFCGGSIISEHYCVTAAHCLNITIEYATVSLGAHLVLNIGAEVGRVDINVTSADFIIHENYDRSTIVNDIGVIRIRNGIVFTDFIQPIQLPAATQQFSGLSTISGWGRTSDLSNEISPTLQYGTANIIGNRRCQILWKLVLSSPQSTNICIGGISSESVTCNGDSGGPLMVQQSGQPVLVGITSYGFSLACKFLLPSVFTRVTEYLSWLSRHTNNEV